MKTLAAAAGFCLPHPHAVQLLKSSKASTFLPPPRPQQLCRMKAQQVKLKTGGGVLVYNNFPGPHQLLSEKFVAKNSMTLGHNHSCIAKNSMTRVNNERRFADETPEGVTLSLSMHDKLLDTGKPGNMAEIFKAAGSLNLGAAIYALEHNGNVFVGSDSRMTNDNDIIISNTQVKRIKICGDVVVVCAGDASVLFYLRDEIKHARYTSLFDSLSSVDAIANTVCGMLNMRYRTTSLVESQLIVAGKCGDEMGIRLISSRRSRDEPPFYVTRVQGSTMIGSGAALVREYVGSHPLSKNASLEETLKHVSGAIHHAKIHNPYCGGSIRISVVGSNHQLGEYISPWEENGDGKLKGPFGPFQDFDD